MKKFSRTIGEVFTFYEGNMYSLTPVDLKVTEVPEPKCTGCYFFRPDEKNPNNPSGCRKIYDYTGECDAESRPDKKNVIFTITDMKI